MASSLMNEVVPFAGQDENISYDSSSEATGELSYGEIVVIKQNGDASLSAPFKGRALIGRGAWCDIRINLPYVSRKHAFVSVDESGNVRLENLCKTEGLTHLNDEELPCGSDPVLLKHGDVFRLCDRRFQWRCSEHLLKVNLSL